MELTLATVTFSISECEFEVTRQPGECNIYRQKQNVQEIAD